MAFKETMFVLSLTTVVFGQRGSFAGIKPIGYPEMVTKPNTVAEGLGNRFGEGDIPATTQRLPVEALGDKALIDRLSKLPVDQQPFWFINWQALENKRRNPQTYPQRPNPFAQPIFPSGPANTNPGVVNANLGNRNNLSGASGPTQNPSSQGTKLPVSSGSEETGSLGNRFGQESLVGTSGTQNSYSGSKLHQDSDAGWKQILQYYDPSYGSDTSMKNKNVGTKH